ncbi:GNAT family N-acetyltransferase [Acetobacterium woodii]|uniref:Acetyltransferase GNAT family n=1 Tax=Acetobacterium woodii (strain ATCC 29683 / DSM 1030 / JCM 2381 / KCTC 1655 / WB1) TaxID=931626 RepID=H6LDS8_ACEWD|nr:GNAT family protein [Acetobacterium woodii]AFA49242.1 acetyltransferase GNAT family [Acetobacterium woodii DSM 1030]
MKNLLIDELSLTEAQLDDYDFFYGIKCEKNSNYWAGFREKPNYLRLKEWYSNVLTYKKKEILIIRYKQLSVGYLSFKIRNNLCDDFSINISEKYVGKGIGTFALHKMDLFLNDYYPDCNAFISYIRYDNIISKKLHVRNGFELDGEYEDKYLESDNKVIRLEKWVKTLKKEL